MTTPKHARLSVSTWSLHRSLGRPAFVGAADGGKLGGVSTVAAKFALLDLPARIAAAGIGTLEICHFHLPSREPSYLKELRNAIAAAGVELWSLLIDDGDITSPQHAARDLAWIKGWIDVAGELGATNTRVIAGKAEATAQTLALSRDHLAQLADHARSRGVRLMTENWFALTATPASVLWLLDQMDGQLGLCADFGNWKGDGKYADLAQIVGRADSCHSKAHFDAAAGIDRADYVRCLELSQQAGFAGPHTLIYDGPSDDEFGGLAIEQGIVTEYL